MPSCCGEESSDVKARRPIRPRSAGGEVYKSGIAFLNNPSGIALLNNLSFHNVFFCASLFFYSDIICLVFAFLDHLVFFVSICLVFAYLDNIVFSHVICLVFAFLENMFFCCS